VIKQYRQRWQKRTAAESLAIKKFMRERTMLHDSIKAL
jgi:hypothetical protein